MEQDYLHNVVLYPEAKFSKSSSYPTKLEVSSIKSRSADRTTFFRKYSPTISNNNSSKSSISMKKRRDSFPLINKKHSRRQISEKNSSIPKLLLEHPEKKYDSIRKDDFTLVNSNNLSSRLSSIEKGIAHQLELYIERERDLEHRLRVYMDENKKLKQEVDRLWSKNLKLVDDVRDAKSKAVEYVQRIEQRYQKERHHRIDMNPETNLLQLSSEEKRLNQKINELKEQIKLKKNHILEMEKEFENKCRIQISNMEKERLKLQALQASIERKRIVLETKEQIMIQQDEEYNLMVRSLQEREGELENIIQERIRKAESSMKNRLNSQLSALKSGNNKGELIVSFTSLDPWMNSKQSNQCHEQELCRLIYFSNSAMLEEREIEEIERVGVKKNSNIGVTSNLYYNETESTIIQVIEGPELKVSQLYELIAQDDRHFNLVNLRKERIEERICPESLSLYNVNQLTASADNVLNYVYNVIRNQYIMLKRYTSPLIQNAISGSHTEELSEIRTIEALIFYVAINICDNRSFENHHLNHDPEKPFGTINHILGIARNSISENEGLFVSFTNNMGVIGIFPDVNTEKATDASIHFFQSLADLRKDFSKENKLSAYDFNPFSSRHVTAVLTKGNIWIGSVGSEGSQIYGPFGYPISLAYKISQNMPEGHCFAFDSEIAKQLSNSFSPKYANKVLKGIHSIKCRSMDGSLSKMVEISTLDVDCARIV